VRELLIASLSGRRRAAPARAPAEPAAGRCPEDPEVTGFVFKVQANMDPNHRDRIAFMRRVLGPFEARHEAETSAQPARRSPSQQRRSSSSPRSAKSRTRRLPGDIVGIPNHGTLRVGDTLTEGGAALHRPAQLRARKSCAACGSRIRSGRSKCARRSRISPKKV
jgi:peptide chain release factor 3